MTKPDAYELIVPAEFENLGLIGEFIAGVARRAGFDEAGVFKVQLACDEACTNVMEHAYEGRAGDIRVKCALHPDRLEIEVRDRGKPFDPGSVPMPDLNAPLEERENGGLGLHFMRSAMDEVRFEFKEDGNHLLMVKRRNS